MAVATIYHVVRIVGLTLNLLCIVISTCQIAITPIRKGPEIKGYVHYSCLGFALLNLILYIDPDGVLDIIPYFLLDIIQYMASEALGAGFCLVIYSHFHAHYLSLREPVPRFLGILLTTSLIIGTSLILVGISLTYSQNREIYSIIVNIEAISWIITVIVSDLYAYYLIRSLIMNVCQKDNKPTPTSSPKNKTRSQEPMEKSQPPRLVTSQSINYTDVLKRMRTFQIVVMILAIVLLIINCAQLLGSLSSTSEGPPIYPSPETFGFNLAATGFILMIVWGALTWWSWVPMCNSDETVSSKETYISNNPSKDSSDMENPVGVSPHSTRGLLESHRAIGDQDEPSEFVQLSLEKSTVLTIADD